MKMNEKSRLLPILIEIFAILFLLSSFALAEDEFSVDPGAAEFLSDVPRIDSPSGPEDLAIPAELLIFESAAAPVLDPAHRPQITGTRAPALAPAAGAPPILELQAPGAVRVLVEAPPASEPGSPTVSDTTPKRVIVAEERGPANRAADTLPEVPRRMATVAADSGSLARDGALESSLFDARETAGLNPRTIGELEQLYKARARQLIRPSQVAILQAELQDPSITPGIIGSTLDEVDTKIQSALDMGFSVERELATWRTASGQFLSVRRFVMEIEQAGIVAAKNEPQNFAALFNGSESLCNKENPNGISFYLEGFRNISPELNALRTIARSDAEEASKPKLPAEFAKGEILRAMVAMVGFYEAELRRAYEICNFYAAHARALAAAAVAKETAKSLAEAFTSLGVGEENHALGESAEISCRAALPHQKRATQTDAEFMENCILQLERDIAVGDRPQLGGRRAVASERRAPFKMLERPPVDNGDGGALDIENSGNGRTYEQLNSRRARIREAFGTRAE